MRFSRLIPLLALLGGGVMSSPTAANAVVGGSVSPTTASGAAPLVTVTWSGLPANDTVFMLQCWRTDADPEFNPQFDCSQSTYQNYPTGPTGAGSSPFTLFGGNDPNGENWGCGPLTTASVKASNCYVRLTTSTPSNGVDDQFFAVDFGGGGTATTGLVPLTAPARVLDTRTGGRTIDAQHQGVGQRAGGSVYELPVGGRAGVPAGASSVVLNVTAVGPVGEGYVTVFPCGAPLPDASNLNYTAGVVVPNAVLSKLGTGGKICLFTYAKTDLLVDVSGYFPDTTALNPLVAPARVLDTRTGGRTIDAQHQGVGQRAGGSVYELPVGGRAGVPAGASSVVLNVTAVGPVGEGYVTVFPCGAPLPDASNLNYTAGVVVPNAVLSKLGTGGKICLFTYAKTDLLVDVSGYFPDTTALNPLVAPARVLDTRTGGRTIDAQHQGVGQRAGGSVYELPVGGRAGVPAGASSVVLNVTAVGPVGEGYVTVFPCGAPLPDASNLNYTAGVVVPNAVLSKLGTGGKICLFTYAKTDLLVDVSGYFV